MLTIAYLSNQFPSAVEPYVAEEIAELRGRGIRVIAGSVARVRSEEGLANADLVLRPAGAITVLRALWLCALHWKSIGPLVWRILFRGAESPLLRVKALVHTLWGGCYAIRLWDLGVDHIHAHHGFSASWIALVAARLLGIEFSMTLHGSDLLIYRTYLDVKLEGCAFCLTVSEYNRRFLLAEHPEIQPDKIVVARLGVDIPACLDGRPEYRSNTEAFRILAVGRLNAVKDHAFLVRACAQLRARGIQFCCEIAGEGPERGRLESIIGRFGLRKHVHLFGHANRDQLNSLYGGADLVVLTSRSEGIPLVLMESMARGKPVLAPAITGIPELVIPGQTGFLYQPGSIENFLDQLIRVRSCMLAPTAEGESKQVAGDLSSDRLRWIRHAARVQVRHNFDRRKNLKSFGDLLLRRITAHVEEIPNESAVLQQI